MKLDEDFEEDEGQPRSKQQRLQQGKKKAKLLQELKKPQKKHEEGLPQQEQKKKAKLPQAKPPRVLNDADEGRTVFVRNVNFSSTAEGLRDYFESNVGPVAECRIVRDHLTEHSKGLAFVKFQAKADADACLLRAAATESGGGHFRLDGSLLRLCLAVTRERLGQLEKAPPAVAEQRRRASAGKRNLHLARAGQLKRGSPEAEGVPESELALREQLERRAREALKNPDVLVSPTRLCVHGLPRDLADRDLRQAFMRLGGPGCRVTECRVMRDTSRLDAGDARLAPGAKVAGRSRGFAFVAYGDHEHAMRAVEAARTGPVLPSGQRLVVQFSLERQSALRKKQKKQPAAQAAPGCEAGSAAAAAAAPAALVSRVPKPAGAQGGVPRAPKRRARDRGAADSAVERKRQHRLEQRRQVAGRLSRKEFRRQRKESLIRDGRLK